ncbi:hypothetical protein FKM82_014647 [Ascaphus truei]|uniref:BTB/POZ domain-containing protein 16 n=1 Tax=Ascaphus truei TaxID=8439 RepID=UPI003F5AA673
MTPGSGRHRSQRPRSLHLPASPPRPPRPGSALSMQRSPFCALEGGDLTDNQRPANVKQIKVPLTCRERIHRNQAGMTNRWQEPYNLDCDLLGTAQAVKAIRLGFNETMRHIMTGDPPVSLTENVYSETPLLTSSNYLPHVSASMDSSPAQIQDKWWSSPQEELAPEEIFYYHSQKETGCMEPKVALECLGVVWEIHHPYLIKSGTLAQLLREALLQKSNQDFDLDAPRQHRTGSRELRSSWLVTRPDTSHSSQAQMDRGNKTKRQKSKINIKLDVQDELVTETSLSIALRNLYVSDIQVDVQQVEGVLAAASLLQFPTLLQECVMKMRSGISSSTVCKYYSTGCKYQQDMLVQACEDWLVVNLVPKLGSHVQLCNVPQELLQRVLKSRRLFTFSEYRLLRLVLYWVYLQQNPNVHILPSHTAVLGYFKSFPKRCAFLQQDCGQKYMALFQSLRLHGITESKQIEEIKQINVIPPKWLIRILSNHFQALQNGGDTLCQTDFNTQAIRFGLIINKVPQYRAEIISRYGFFFELKAVRHEPCVFSFYMQRLKHTDPILSVQTLECKSLSLRQQREVRYEIRAQCLVHKKWREFSTGILTQKYGVTSTTRKSKVLKVLIPSSPIYVTYALLFPPA